MIFDTHAHYDDEAFDPDREELLSRLPGEGIGRVVNVTASLDSVDKSIALARNYPYIFSSVGIHPSDIAPLNDEICAVLEGKLTCDRVVAVGEIGLDYYWEKDPMERERQRTWFRRQLDMARRAGLPVIIHSRDAAADTLTIAKDEKLREIGGVMHCYSYSLEHAREYLNMGLFLGIGGVLTYKNARVLREVVAYAPLEQLVLETDCPYLTPVPHRGERNSSLNLKYVAEAIARIKGISPEEAEEITWNNAMRLYRMG